MLREPNLRKAQGRARTLITQVGTFTGGLPETRLYCLLSIRITLCEDHCNEDGAARSQWVVHTAMHMDSLHLDFRLSTNPHPSKASFEHGLLWMMRPQEGCMIGKTVEFGRSRRSTRLLYVALKQGLALVNSAVSGGLRKFMPPIGIRDRE